MKVKYMLVVVLTTLALLLSACGGGGGQPAGTAEPASPADTAEPIPPGEPDEPAILKAGWAGSPDTLNPGTAVLSEAYTIFEMVYDSMYQLNLDGTYSLELADSIDVSEDGLVWTFHIRDGFTFHDGTPLTANDIAFSYNYYQANEDFPFLSVYTGYFASVEATDDSTVVITLTEAIPNMESQLIFLYVLPQHVW
jgi:peptide/nickel transport system substrate-binding protein